MIGATARALLTRPGFAGRVLTVVTGAVYLTGVIARSDFRDEAIPNSQFGDCFASLAMTHGEILWLARNDLPMHTRAWRGDFNFGALRAGMAFQSDGAQLEFVGATGRSPLQIADVRVWQPPTIDPARVAPRETVIAGVGATGRSPLPFADARVWQPPTIDPARVVPRETVIAGVGATGRSPLQFARDLVGLGEGLTPSGDDFVGGFLFTAYHLRAVYGDAFGWDARAVDDLLAYARTRTNVISYALLRDHARGESVEPLHDWLATLLYGASPREIETHARRVRAIGSTTGENLLAGARAALEHCLWNELLTKKVRSARPRGARA